MRAALLNLVDRVADGSLPSGCLPVADGMVVLLQIDLAQRLGAEEVLCLVDNPPAQILEIEAYAARLGLRFTMVRSLADASVRLSADDEVLLIADGLFVAPAEADALAAQNGSRVVAFAPTDQEPLLAAGFERIDINHVWAGLAVIKGTDLFEARNLPDDWSPQSTLLRIAVQRGYRREVRPLASFERRRLAYPADRNESIALGLLLAGGASAELPDFDRALWSSGPGEAVARRLWTYGWAASALRAGAFGLPALALALAGAILTEVIAPAWAAAAFALLLLGRLASGAMRSLHGHFAGRRAWRHDGVVGDTLYLATAAALIIGAESGDALFASFHAASMFAGLWLLLRWRSLEGAPNSIRAGARALSSPILFAFLAGTASLFGALAGIALVWSMALLALILILTYRERA